jgi:hypothetical protein
MTETIKIFLNALWRSILYSVNDLIIFRMAFYLSLDNRPLDGFTSSAMCFRKGNIKSTALIGV